MSAQTFFSLQDQVALVTGGSRGIGAEIAKRLAKAGAQVIVNYRSNREAAEKVVGEIQEYSPSSTTLAFDVSDASSVDKAIGEIQEKWGGPQILVANAGVSKDALLPRSRPEQFEEVFQTNFFGVVHVVRASVKSMMKNRYGRVICMSSVVGEMGNKGQSAYASSKSAIFGFVKSVAQELGSRQVTVNALAPGFIETEMTDRLDETVKESYFENIPLRRFGTTREVAAAVQFLASEEAGYITGATLDINGGLLMR